MSPMSQAAQNLNWLITNFVDNTPGVSHTVVVSADGLLLAMSEGFPRDRADQLAAVASGLTSLTAGASRIFEGGPVSQTVVEMERGFLFLMSVSDGSSLAVLAHPECDIGLVGYEMALLVDRAGSVLTRTCAPSSKEACCTESASPTGVQIRATAQSPSGRPQAPHRLHSDGTQTTCCHARRIHDPATRLSRSVRRLIDASYG